MDKRKLWLTVFALFFIPILATVPIFGVLPSSLGTTTSEWGAGNDTYCNTLWFSDGLHWAFWSDGTDLVFKTSSDGETWSGSSTAKTTVAAGYMFGLFYDQANDYVHVIVGSQVGGNAMEYRMGRPHSNGSIVWETAAWQTVLNEANYAYLDPMINIATTGEPWIGYSRWYDPTDDPNPYVITSDFSNGTWSTRSGFPYQLDTLNSTGNPGWYVLTAQLDAGDMYVMYHDSWNNTAPAPILKGRIWDEGGDIWGAITNCSTYNQENGAQISVVDNLPNDDIYLTGQKREASPKDHALIRYDKDGDTWSVILDEVATGGSTPHLAYDATYNTLYYVLTGFDWKETSHIYYRRFDVTGQSWAPWVEWFDAGAMTSQDRQSSSQYIFNNQLALIWQTGAGSPYSVYYNYLNITGDIYSYTFIGLYSEYNNTQFVTGVNATVYVDGYDPDTFLVNGTVNRDFYSVPRYATFDLPNHDDDREYWFSSGENATTIYIYTDTDMTTYTIYFLDLAGILDDYPFVKALTWVNGTQYVIEKRVADIEKKVRFVLKDGRTYSIVIEGATSHTYGDLLMTDVAIVQLTVKGVNFPKETLLTYPYVRIYGTRAFGTPNGNITITYDDTLLLTTSVDIYINYQNGTNVYNATETADSFNHVWASALNNTDYAVVVDIDHQRFGTYTWKQYFPRTFSVPPWGLGFLGTLPFDTSIIIPMFLILFVAGAFSQINAEVGAFMAVVTAAILTYMGWIAIEPGALITAISLALLMGIIYAKRRVQT